VTPRSPSRRTPKLVNAKLNAPRVKGYQVVTETDTKIISSLPQTVIRGDHLLFDDPKPGFADG
jgi:hypothetical protein